MSKAFLAFKGKSGYGYRITLPGLVILLVGFAALMPYCLKYDAKAFFVLSAVAFGGAALGLLAGPPKLELRVDTYSVMMGLLAAGVVGITNLFMHVAQLSVVGYTVLYAAVCEELAFRFGVQRLAERVMGLAVGIVFQAGLFMLYHWVVYPGYTFMAAYPLIAGLVFGSVNALSGDLTPSLVAHFTVNLLVAFSFG